MVDNPTTILLIDDNPEDVETYKRMLKKSSKDSFLILNADCGRTGLELQSKSAVDCILLDYNLPDADGFELLEKLSFQGIPVVLLTGHGNEHIAVQALKKGAADYLVKGQIDAPSLLRSIGNAIKWRRSEVEREKAMKALLESEQLYRTLIQNSFSGVYVIQDDKFQFINNIVLLYTGYAEEELIGQNYLSIVREEDRKRVEKNRTDMLKGQINSPYEFGILTKDGQVRWIMETVASITYQGKPAILGNSMDFSERKKAEEEVRLMAISDPLTGLLNRRGFLTLSEQQFKLSQRTKKGIVLYFIDVDRMKQINDHLGHLSGDMALADCACIFKETFRDSDICARTGGDEFAVFAIDSTDRTAEVALERLQKKVDLHNQQKNRPYVISLSIGFCACPPDVSMSLNELMSRANQAMYQSKKAKDPPPVVTARQQ